MIKRFRTLINSSDKRRLLGNFASLSVLRGFQFLIPLITLPYLVKTVGIENFGLINFALSLGLYFGAVIQFGFSITATREIARHRDDPQKLAKIYSTTLTASVLLALFSVLIFTVIVLSFEKFSSYFNLYLFTMAFVVFQSLFPIWFFLGMEKMKYITYLALGTNVMFLSSIFIFVTQENDYILVPLLHAIAAFITFALSLVVISKQFKVQFTNPKWSELKAAYAEGNHAFISQLAPNLYNNSSVFLLGVFTSNTIVGYYSAATKVIDALISIGYILSNTFLPYLSRSLKKHAFFQKIMISSGLVLTVSIVITSDLLVEGFFGIDNLIISEYIQWLAPSIFMLFITLTYSTNYLMLIGREKVVKNIALYTSLLYFLLALILIPIWGVWAAILVLVGARVTIAVLNMVFYYRYCKTEGH